MNRVTCILWVLTGLLLISPVGAKKLYKYQDEKGQWHFTDRRPDDAKDVETEQLNVAGKKQKVSVRNLGTAEEPVFHIINEYYGPVEVEVKLTRQGNIITQPSLPLRAVIPAASDVPIFKLSPVSKNQAWSYRLEYNFVMGDSKAEHRPPKPYSLPFAKGQSFYVSQGFHGSFSHNHPQSEYAVDITMPEGTQIRAARAGIVMDIANDFYMTGTDPEYMSKANSIRLLHDDGTMAIYAHLKLETAQVSVGMRVAEGQFIAESGNTGFSTGPHLHFAVQKNADMELVSVPFEFESSIGQAIKPEMGMLLTAH